MKEKNIPGISNICILDLSLAELQLILGNEEIAGQLTEFDDSSALERIDELISMKEAEQTVLLLNDEAVFAMRNEWTIQIPNVLADSIHTLLTANSKIVY